MSGLKSLLWGSSAAPRQVRCMLIGRAQVHTDPGSVARATLLAKYGSYYNMISTFRKHREAQEAAAVLQQTYHKRMKTIAKEISPLHYEGPSFRKWWSGGKYRSRVDFGNEVR
eukprot:GDKH01016402.1.p2 GENE.GDKH01016402.1~~GDKH01016402.1.p2  ORF type:complete len:113 (-),score=8.48 GDKH01016402.1:86-424(-)